MRTSFLTGVLLCLLLTSSLLAPEPAKEPPSGPVVSLSLIVTNKDGKVVSSIRKDQLQVFENKVEQKVLALETDERPVDYIVVLDSTGSFKDLFESALEAMKILIINRRPADEVALVRFVNSDKIETVQKFTADNKVLLASLDDMYLEEGQSAVIDALYLSADYVSTYNKGNEGRRKVVVVITDGEDRISYYKQKDLMNLLHERGVQVFVLGLVVDLDRTGKKPGARNDATRLLQAVGEESGGRVFLPENKEQLVAASAEILMDLRAQFRIKYQSANDAAKKGFRNVEVKFVSDDGEKRNVITPRGYFVGPAPHAKKEK